MRTHRTEPLTTQGSSRYELSGDDNMNAVFLLLFGRPPTGDERGRARVFIERSEYRDTSAATLTITDPQPILADNDGGTP